METTGIKNNNTYLTIIGVLSVLIPIVVAFLLFMPHLTRIGGVDVSFLPLLNAVMNTSTAIALVAGYIFIKQKNIARHRTAMFTAFTLSSIFLVSYVIYHSQAEHTTFGGDGFVKWVYYLLLISHILLAIVVVPLVLLAIYYAVSQQIDKHKKIVTFTYPVWLYVAVTGVLVYLMISPYYSY